MFSKDSLSYNVDTVPLVEQQIKQNADVNDPKYWIKNSLKIYK